MNVAATLLGLVVLSGLVWLVSAPLRAQASGRQTPGEERDAHRRQDLELRRDRTYADIRELEMDLRTGKLSEEDYRKTDRQLRAEAVDILHELDRMGPADDPGEEPEPPAAPVPEPPAGQARDTDDASSSSTI
jgi:hypothetical protein